ncbi:hypothetical protein SAMN04487943_102468 [Gracilibacillus orientalis]|uniref:Uncharacterized protein n=1 Tax=Gracilibacillus orientalis TaxID=334253 RepID=A0A1I4J4T6_9BACI|nr:hypothetical protein [Gracilibacillus orientalis]SFL61615.1 hypothetical protein SAMN04487943_102468 [Gracilibacillus orientalis]
MLTFDQKLKIVESFPELTRHNVSMNRVNFHYEESANDKKNVVYHLHPNGNGFVYAEYLNGYDTDHKGLINIRDFSDAELRTVIQKSIESLVSTSAEAPLVEEFEEERWINSEKQSLLLLNEEDLWNVYADQNLDGTFRSYNEARAYLEEEGFTRT